MMSETKTLFSLSVRETSADSRADFSTARIHIYPGFVRSLLLLAAVSALTFVCGCSSPNAAVAGAERGPRGTIAYKVLIESSEPGVRIEANKEFVGNTPLELKVFGDKDGTFHCFGSPHYVIQAIPVKPGQNLQTKFFRTGEAFTGEDMIPRRIFFDMSQPENTRIERGNAPVW